MSQTTMLQPTEQIAEFFACGPSRQETMAFRLSDESLASIRDLLYKNSAGTLTSGDAQELDELVLLDRIVNLIRSRVDPATPDQSGSASAL
jgi:hypothetical protein